MHNSTRYMLYNKKLTTKYTVKSVSFTHLLMNLNHNDAQKIRLSGTEIVSQPGEIQPAKIQRFT